MKQVEKEGMKQNAVIILFFFPLLAFSFLGQFLQIKLCLKRASGSEYNQSCAGYCLHSFCSKQPMAVEIGLDRKKVEWIL